MGRSVEYTNNCEVQSQRGVIVDVFLWCSYCFWGFLVTASFFANVSYARLRRRLLIDPHILKEESCSSDVVVDNPLSQNPGNIWCYFPILYMTDCVAYITIINQPLVGLVSLWDIKVLMVLVQIIFQRTFISSKSLTYVTHVVDPLLSTDSTWGRFFRNAELEKMVDRDLSRLYPEHGSFFQTLGCQRMLRRILLLWCLRHAELGYRQGNYITQFLVFLLVGHTKLHYPISSVWQSCNWFGMISYC